VDRHDVAEIISDQSPFTRGHFKLHVGKLETALKAGLQPLELLLHWKGKLGSPMLAADWFRF
jgi:hypothetical protein